MITVEKFYSEIYKPGIICTDSRKIRPGDVFIALSGDNFNGNSFAESALKNGASLVILDDVTYAQPENTVLVENCLLFMQNLAKLHRQSSNFHILGLTGTNGKTTTKELIVSVLSEKYKCAATYGNMNNHIGVPLTILAIPSNTDYAIIEMGANHQGEINALCEIAMPDSGIITNIGKAHLEGFGGFEGVIRAKSELYNYLKSGNKKIYYNSMNPILTRLVGNYSNNVAYESSAGLCYGLLIDVNPTLKLKLFSKDGKNIEITTQLFGKYNMENVVAAACIGLDIGLSLDDIKHGIEKYLPSNNRSQFFMNKTNTYILDCYNANPTSMQEALVSFSSMNLNNKIIILGGMKELGEFEAEEHIKLGELIESLNFSEVILVGPEFKDILIPRVKHFQTVESLKNYLNKIEYKNSAFLIKGSRANQLEQLLCKLK